MRCESPVRVGFERKFRVKGRGRREISGGCREVWWGRWRGGEADGRERRTGKVNELRERASDLYKEPKTSPSRARRKVVNAWHSRRWLCGIRVRHGEAGRSLSNLESGSTEKKE